MTPRPKFLLAMTLCVVSALSIAARFQPKPISLLEKRAGFETQLLEKETSPWSLDTPPEGVFDLITYETSIGKMEAYVSPAPAKGTKSAAIIWLTGGFPGSTPGSHLWDEPNFANEQTASVFRNSGIVSMYPALRGRSSNNPGVVECFYGEVNDVIDAYRYLSKLDYVDSNKIYLGGHSTGGTLALLVAAATDVFAGVISLGPTHDDYGEDYAPYEWTEKERNLRAPIHHLDSIKSITYIIEGDGGNYYSLQMLDEENQNPLVKIIAVRDADHFQIIHPVNTIFANEINASKDGSLEIDPIAIQMSASDL